MILEETLEETLEELELPLRTGRVTRKPCECGAGWLVTRVLWSLP